LTLVEREHAEYIATRIAAYYGTDSARLLAARLRGYLKRHPDYAKREILNFIIFVLIDFYKPEA